MTSQQPPEGLSASFGDIIENGWASADNPTRTGIFVREGRRMGRMNAGRFFEVTDGKGHFWELPLGRDHKITVRPAARSTSPAPTAWRPIESAPQDGTVVLVYRLPDWRSAPIIPAFWCDDADGLVSAEMRRLTPHATHWCPLPTPPNHDGSSGPDRVEQGIACIQMAMTAPQIGTAKAMMQAALDFLTNDQEALAEGRQWADPEDGE